MEKKIPGSTSTQTKIPRKKPGYTSLSYENSGEYCFISLWKFSKLESFVKLIAVLG